MAKFNVDLSKAKELAGKVVDKTKEMIDRNDDGKLDMEDVSVVADAVSEGVMKGAAAMLEAADNSRKEMELKLLNPIFEHTLQETDFLMSKLIRVTDRDKRHTESDVCQGSIGYLLDKGGLRIVNIFNDSIDAFGLTFYPNVYSEFYYVNPTDRDNYISLDNYFEYMKTVRVNELQRVAQDLGAKHFKVTYKEENAYFSNNKSNAGAKVNKAKEAEASFELEETKSSKTYVAAEMNLEGHDPVEPKLVYLAKDDSVNTLIHMRMTEGSKFHSHKISIKLSSASGIKESDAIKIDAVLKGLKVVGNATVANEVRNESRRSLEYEIDF